MKVKRIKNYIDGKWLYSKSDKELDVENPAFGEVIAKVPLSNKVDLEEAVKAAKYTYENSWRDMPVLKRVEYLFKLKNLIISNLDEIATILTKEHGKPLNESKLEIQRAVDNINAAAGIPTFMQGRILENIVEGTDEQMIRQPLGVFGIIAPFNFPAMIPFWYLPYAIASGNTILVKPSELTPLTQNYIFKLIKKTGLPRGVVNLINGDKEISNALVEHKDVAGIASVTSTSVAKHIYQKAASLGKRVQCHGGAKNFIVVLPDANLDASILNIIKSAFGNTGQRCLAAANIVAVGESYKNLREKLIVIASRIKIGYGLEKNIDMGPVISKKAKERILKYIEEGIKEKAKLIIDGRNVKVDKKYKEGYFLGPCIFDNVDINMSIAREEIFGPVLSIHKAKNLDEAIKMIHSIDYGNAATIYTKSGKFAREFQHKVQCGNIGINIGVPAPYACFPFCGMKNSFYGDIHAQCKDMINFFTQQKVIVTKWY
ncbi:MAG: CoA-acylating methylmalonate-semialdehyde dehydrogenase [Candidatus Hodarchaeota archaeon]